MRNAKLVGMVAAALLALVAAHAQAQGTPPQKAKTYSINFARAFDACVGPGVTVVNPGTVGACSQANLVTDGTVTAINTASLKLGVSKTNGVSLKLKGKGIVPSVKVGLQMTLRTTNGSTASPPPASKTYNDETVVCGTTDGDTCGHFFAVDTNGKLLGKETLKDCLDRNDLPDVLASGNIEILSASLINCDTGKAIANAGLLQLP